MSSRWKLYYGVAAIAAAAFVIVAALLGAPLVNSRFAKAWQFPIMLTDPPIVPEGTTLLDFTYSDILLHISHSDNTATWLPVEAKGTVNLLSLVNVSQTLAAVTLPEDSEVNKIQFTIEDLTATIDGTDYDVTPLSDTIVLSVQNSKVNNAQSGVLVDFYPTLIETQSIDADGNTVNVYVLLPRATARIISGLSDEQTKVGSVINLRPQDIAELAQDKETINHNVSITYASLWIKGNQTTFSVTLKNQETSAVKLFGVTLQGIFDSAKIKNGIFNTPLTLCNNEEKNNDNSGSKNSTRTIPFKIEGLTLTPLFGTNSDNESNDENGYLPDSLTIEACQEVTLMFEGVIQNNDDGASTYFVPLECHTYTIRLIGEGSQTFAVEAVKKYA